MKHTAATREFDLLIRWATGRPADAKSLRAFRAAARRVGPDVAGDLAAAVAMRVAEAGPNERTDEAVCRAVWSTVKKAVRDAVRMRGHGVAAGADESSPKPEVAAIVSEEKQKLAAAIGAVLEADEQELLLDLAAGSSFAEIAARRRDGVGMTALRKRAERARAKVRAALS